MGLTAIFIALAVVAGVGSYLTERVDRPRRRAERHARQAAAHQ